jgi:CRISPR-associated protein Csc1
MSDKQEIKLAGRIRVFAGQLYNHDYLWFSSSEISKTSVTLPYLHNYALSYALSQFERSSFLGSTPTYAADLDLMPLYATPAGASNVETTLVTFNALDSITMRTDVKPNVNTPDLGKRRYLNPVYEDRNVSKPERGYTFYAFTYGKELPRSVFRLGKKGCSVRVQWTEIEWAKAEWIDEPVRPSHPVNPLDVSGKIIRFDPIMLPPHLLMRVADISGDWFVRRGPHTIHIPKRVVTKAGLSQA